MHKPARTAVDPGEGTVVFTTSWCGYCYRLKAALNAAGVAYREIDIETVPGAADIVTAVNGGNRTVPTVVFADGSTMTNPPAEVVARRTAELARTGPAQP